MTPSRYAAFFKGKFQRLPPTNALLTFPNPPAPVTTIKATSGVMSPFFFGMHNGDDPASQPVAAVPYKTLRSVVYTEWPNIETSAGVYNSTVVNKLVRITDRCVAQNQRFVFTHTFTPRFASSNPNTPSDSGNALPLGGAEVLSSQTFLTNFINYILGLLAPKFKAAGLQLYIECRNEPNDPRFWHGTPAQLVTECQTIWNAVQAYNTANSDSVKVISCSVSQPPYLGNFSAPGSTTNFQTLAAAGMMNYCDIAGYHAYAASLSGIDDDFATHIANIRARTAKPIWITEVGDINISGKTTSDIARWYLKAWALGIECFCYFSYDNEGVPGMAMNQISGAAGAANTLLSGKTIGWVNSNTTNKQLGALINGVATII